MRTIDQSTTRTPLKDSDLTVNHGEKGINAFIGKGVVFKGTLTYHGTIRIDGTVEGEVRTDGYLLIGEGAMVTATIRAGTLICKGTIQGEVVALDRVRLKAPSVFTGSVVTPSFSLEEGVTVNASVAMGEPTGDRVTERQDSQKHDVVAAALSLA